MKQIIPTEEQDQIALVEYLELQNIKFSSVPNSTYTKSFNQKRKNTANGLRKGLPDLLLIIKNRLVFIEMKRLKGGVIGKEQKEWNEELNKCTGVKAFICKGFEEAKEVVDNFLKKP